MKVLHIGLTSHFTDKMLYQDNILSDLNAKAGHDVTFISDTFEYKNGSLDETDECDIRLDNGVRLIRLKYDRIINDFVTNKIQKCKKLVDYLNEIQPNMILYHGVCGFELMDVAQYVKRKQIRFYIDSHENFQNTAMTFISKLAYKYIHGYFIKKAIPVVNKVLYIGYPEKDYLDDMYYIPKEKLEYFPLGGIILEREKQKEYRSQLIEKLGFSSDVIICSHSGKMDVGKKTKEVLMAFQKVPDKRLRLLIYGSIPKDMKTVLEPMMKKDSRVVFLGWKTAMEQEEILGATDLYIQPGTYSATAQIALCEGCALIVNRGYKRTMKDAVIYGEEEKDIEMVLTRILSEQGYLENIKETGFNYAKKSFDYKILAQRYLQ